MFKSKFYTYSPIWVQNIIVSLRGFLRRIVFENRSAQAQKKRLLCNEAEPHVLNEFHQNKLQEVLQHAATKVPFYRNALNGKPPVLESFPIIDKSVVLEHAAEFKADDSSLLLLNSKTSSTSGIALSVKQDMRTVIKEQGFVMRMYLWAGFTRKMKSAWIRGDMIVPLEQTKAPFWRYSLFERTLLMSSYHLNQDALPLYLEKLQQFGVQVIRAYPSSIVPLANYLKQQDDYYPDNLTAIITSSESLTEDNKQLIEERFRCRVFDWYGLSERVAAISSCEYGSYHVLTDYSHIEFDDMGDGTHEIIGTSFNNRSYPLIRYRTGDFIELSQQSYCPCQRAYPIVSRIKGRRADFVYDIDGNKVYNLCRHARKVSGVISSQFIQNEERRIQVNILTTSDFGDECLDHLEHKLHALLGKKMQFDIDIVQQLERTRNGKVRQINCRVKYE